MASVIMKPSETSISGSRLLGDLHWRCPADEDTDAIVRRSAVAWRVTPLMVVGVALLVGRAAGESMSTRGPAGTVGAYLLDVAPNTIGLRYRMRVNACADNVGKKIVFIGVRTATPEAPLKAGRGTIDMDVITDWVRYEDDLGHPAWPEPGLTHPGEPSLSLRNVDYDGVGRVGFRPLTPVARRLFPRQCAGIDGIPGLTAIAAIHQGSILGQDVQLTLVRQPLTWFGPALDWGRRFTPRGTITPVLPPGGYWPWLLTVAIDGGPPTQLLFLLDETRGQYIVPDDGVSIRTEYFLRPDLPPHLLGDLQVFVWDVETLRESGGAWEPRTRWVYREDATPSDPAVGYGFRTTTHETRRALEVSYFALGYDLFRHPGYYARVGDVLDLTPR